MKFLIIFSLILCVSTFALAAEVVGFYKDPAHPGKCVYDSLILSPGEEGKLPNTCARFSCGSNSFAKIHSCGVMLPPPECEFTEYININAQYPDCCKKKLVC